MDWLSSVTLDVNASARRSWCERMAGIYTQKNTKNSDDDDETGFRA